MEKRQQILLPAVFITALVFAGLFFHFLQQYIEEQYASNEVYRQQKIEYMNAHNNIQSRRYFYAFPPASSRPVEKHEVPVKKECSNSENEKRICKDGSLIPMYRSGCFAAFCQEGSGENEVIYYSPYVQKDGRVFIEEDHGYYNLNLAPIDGADISTFRPVGACASAGGVSRTFYGRDKNHVYVNHKPMDDIDAQSFKYIGLFHNREGPSYSLVVSVDKNTVYFNCGKIVDEIDRQSFEMLGEGYFRDSKNVYYLDRIVNRADHDTFEPIIYEATDEIKIYGRFAVDKNHVFFEGLPMKKLNPATCKEKGIENCLPAKWGDLVDRSVPGVKIFNEQSTNKQGPVEKVCSNNENEKRICADGALIPMYESGCSATLCHEGSGENEVMYYSPYVKKDRRVFIEGQYDNALTSVVGADATTFRPIGTCASVERSGAFYGKDKNHVYTNDKPVKDIDVRSFKYLGVFGNAYELPYSVSISVDKDAVYFGCGKVVPSVDRRSFTALGHGYSRDSKNIYFLDSIMASGVDRDTFKVIDYEPTNKIHGSFASDKNQVFFEGLPLKEVDPVTCKERGLESCLPAKWGDLVDRSVSRVRIEQPDESSKQITTGVR